jgi:hypothetical protein
VARRSQPYDEATIAVRELVGRHDPEGLLALGAPTDEYVPEVSDLVRLVLAEPTATRSEVDQIWRRWFGDAHPLSESKLTAFTDDLRALQLRFENNA